MLDKTSRVLDRPVEGILEDIETFLVSNPEVEALRRLLRFARVTYVEFLHSLDDLADRTRLAADDLHLPAMELRERAPGQFSLMVYPGLPGFVHVMMDVQQAMADDYGALAMLTHNGQQEGVEVISIALVESYFAEG